MKYMTEYDSWVRFYPSFNTSFFVEAASYFDERPQIHTSVTQLIVLVVMPILAFYTPLAFLLFPFISSVFAAML